MTLHQNCFCETKPFWGCRLRIAYLINQYPKTSHTFIRREIAALEAQGLDIERFSIRPTQEELVDPADKAEREKTRALLSAGTLQLLLALTVCCLSRPARLCRTLLLAAKMETWVRTERKAEKA